MVAARVHIDNPDSNVYLGIEARLKITTAQRQDALLVPVEAVNIDNDGNFCYIIENGALVKKYITTGISSSDYIEVTDGLSEKEEVVTSAVMDMDLEEGMEVTPMSETETNMMDIAQ